LVGAAAVALLVKTNKTKNANEKEAKGGDDNKQVVEPTQAIAPRDVERDSIDMSDV
jgi:hypothetical protein